MPPKQSQQNKNKEKQKKVEDLTFGLKGGKSSAKVKKQIAQIKTQVMSSGNKKEMMAAEARKKELQDKKALEEQKKKELAELFRPVQVQKVPFGVDPKTILCEFFKQGSCQKGNKCKFSHDLGVARKSAKIDLYTDTREKEKDGTMEDWDQKKLEQVVLSKHGNPRTTTDIVCKFFLEAIESSKYGWFWACPNGGDTCKYKHALPPGFVLKSKEKKVDNKEDEISLEDFLEVERHKLGSNLTPVTWESFNEWKKTRKERAAAEEESKRKATENAIKAGRVLKLSGKDFFEFNPSLVGDIDEGDDEDVFDFSQYEREDGDGNYANDGESSNAANYDTTTATTTTTTDASLAEKTQSMQISAELYGQEDIGDLDDDDD
ncbi:hypothetical protein GQ42DRAFT_172498 [Ramicandelaber brevisporus]|nr:hypothetical protein GQ42DRAFT_172498 [Ramicandelaber brevisporus]